MILLPYASLDICGETFGDKYSLEFLLRTSPKTRLCFQFFSTLTAKTNTTYTSSNTVTSTAVQQQLLLIKVLQSKYYTATANSYSFMDVNSFKAHVLGFIMLIMVIVTLVIVFLSD